MAITIDYGYRTYELCDPDGNVLGVLRFNPSDPGFVGRWEQLKGKAERLIQEEPQTPEQIAEYDSSLKAMLDEAFAAPVSAVLFQGLSCFALCEDGSFVLEHILNALEPVIRDALERAAKSSDARIAARAAAYEGTTQGLAPGQQA